MAIFFSISSTVSNAIIEAVLGLERVPVVSESVVSVSFHFYYILFTHMTNTYAFGNASIEQVKAMPI